MQLLQSKNRPTVPGGCSHGSPSTCMGKRFFTLTTTWLHCANLLPEDLKPVLTWPIWRQFSRPTTSMSLSPISTVKRSNIGRVRCEMSRIQKSKLPSFKGFDHSILANDLPCTARERSMSLLKEAPWSLTMVICFFLLFLEALLRRLLALESPHILVPPWVEGMLRNVMPWRGGPSLRLSGTPSH